MPVSYQSERIPETAAIIDVYESSGINAPTAMKYYPKVGFLKADNAFLIKRKR